MIAAAPSIPIGPGVAIPGRFANRHALVAGATGTGKSTTVATLAEGFAAIGTPSLVLDVKGDLAGLATANPTIRLDPFVNANLELWRLGPDLIARAMDLSDAQAGALDVAFAVQEAEGWPLSTLADLRALLQHLAAHTVTVSAAYGLVSASSIAAVQRAALRLERSASGAFGTAAIDMGAIYNAKGMVHVLACDRITRTAGLYGALCAFILTDSYDRFPEVGDLDRPRLAIFLDESHLIFDGAPPALVRRLEQVVRLIRSKGVCLLFATQSPADLPAPIAGQLQNRIQHGLRGVTPADQRGIRAAADSMPSAPGIDAAGMIAKLGVGQALVSVVGPGGVPSPVQLVQVHRSRARLGPLPVSPIAAVEPVAPVVPFSPPSPRSPAYFPDAGATLVDREGEPPAPKSSGRIALDRLLIGIPIVLAFWWISALINAAT